MSLEQIEELEDLDEKRKKRRKRKRKVKKKKGKRDACYYKVKRRYKIWPSAYASGALVQCRKKGAKNWGNKSKKKRKNESMEINEKKNCGCGQDPCVTYGDIREEFKPHMMYDPKTGKSVKANKEEDHHRLAKQGYTHVDPKDLEKVLKDEGGASGMDPFVKAVGKGMEDEIEDTLKDMPNVGQHKDKDYILDDGEEIDVQKEQKMSTRKIRVRIKRKVEEAI